MTNQENFIQTLTSQERVIFKSTMDFAKKYFGSSEEESFTEAKNKIFSVRKLKNNKSILKY
jgi:hypothetical protein